MVWALLIFSASHCSRDGYFEQTFRIYRIDTWIKLSNLFNINPPIKSLQIDNPDFNNGFTPNHVLNRFSMSLVVGAGVGQDADGAVAGAAHQDQAQLVRRPGYARQDNNMSDVQEPGYDRQKIS